MCALLNKQSHANHSFQLCIFDCSCTVIMCTTLLRAVNSYRRCFACTVLNNENHANHSFQLYIFVWLYSYHAQSAALRNAVQQWSLLRNVHC
jgi:hypothetical protein